MSDVWTYSYPAIPCEGGKPVPRADGARQGGTGTTELRTQMVFRAGSKGWGGGAEADC